MPHILTVNVGSSSVKMGMYLCQAASSPMLIQQQQLFRRDETAAQDLRAFIDGCDGTPAAAVAHRLVHGGPNLQQPCRVNEAVVAELVAISPLAPLHNPPAIHWLRTAQTVLPQVPQVAVFDTALYSHLPTVARHYALPEGLTRAHAIRRYGFHGLAHACMWRAYAARHPEQAEHARVISLQLGSGCSMTALRGGQALDTSMGFSPLEGLVMGTRCGDIDAGLIFYLLKHGDMTPNQLEDLLQHRSGLAGVSGLSANMQDILAASTAAARLARDLFCYRIQKYLGAFVAVLGGVDAMLLGGGIAEHSATIRRLVAQGFAWSGARLDDAANQADLVVKGAELVPLHRKDSLVQMYVVGVDEGALMAEQAGTLIGH